MAVDAASAGTRPISDLSPKAQAAYKADPQLAAKRGEQVAAKKSGSNGSSSSSATSTSSDSDGSKVINLPSTSDVWGAIPGESALIKALVVAGILLLGMAWYSRATGQTFTLGLFGLSPGVAGTGSANAANGTPAAAVGIPTSRDGLSPAILTRTVKANPAKVGA